MSLRPASSIPPGFQLKVLPWTVIWKCKPNKPFPLHWLLYHSYRKQTRPGSITRCSFPRVLDLWIQPNVLKAILKFASTLSKYGLFLSSFSKQHRMKAFRNYQMKMEAILQWWSQSPHHHLATHVLPIILSFWTFPVSLWLNGLSHYVEPLISTVVWLKESLLHLSIISWFFKTLS